ncbi:MAG: family 1 glycosylhydrolase [Verrucomicrobiota bacterium]
MPPETAAPRPPFLWGVATSSYQVEGGYNEGGLPHNNWAWPERANRVVPTGAGSRFWDFYEADLDRCQSLGLNALRLGIEWARVQPVTTLPSMPEHPERVAFDEAALDRYADLLAACRVRGLEPMLTWHHFVHPAWLGRDAWLEPGTPQAFAAYVRTAWRGLLERCRDRGIEPPRRHLTLNEPNALMACTYLLPIFPSGLRPSPHRAGTCLAHLLEAHLLAYRALHDLAGEYGQTVEVSTNFYASDLYWLHQGLLDTLRLGQLNSDPAAAYLFLRRRERAYRQRLREAGLRPRTLRQRFAGHHIRHWQYRMARSIYHHPDMGRMLRQLCALPRPPLDFAALDYYDPLAGNLLRSPSWADYEARPRRWRDWLLEAFLSKWWDWECRPEGLGFFVREAAAAGLPVYLTENGMAYRQPVGQPAWPRDDGISRSQYLHLMTEQVRELVRAGVDLRGYFHWSLIDNYEWGTFSARFGLYQVDFSRPERPRSEVDAFGDRPARTYRQIIAEARAETGEPAAPPKVTPFPDAATG